MITAKKVTPEKLARRYFLKKKWGKAIDEYQKLLREDDSNLQIVNLIGDANYLKSNPEEAFIQYRKALASYEDEGLFDNAIAVAKKILRLNPSENDIHLKLAELYTDQGFLADALLHLTTYLNAVGKRLDEKTVRSIYQKIASIPNENPHLWDEITDSYHRLNINDPELDRIMTPGGMSPELQTAAKQPDSIPTGHETPLPDQETIESDLSDESESQPIEIEAHKTQEISQTSEPPLDFPIEELPLQDRDLTSALQPPDNDESSANIDQSALYPAPEETTDSEIESDLLGQEDSASIDLQLANILREVLPPEEEPDQSSVSSTEESSQDESIIESGLEESSRDSFTADSEPDLTSSLESDLSSMQKESSEETEPEPDIVDQTVDTPISLADDGHFGMETLDALPKTNKESTESEEDEPLWTIPFEVAEESVPEDIRPEEVTIEKVQEHQAVESMLTGFSGDAKSRSTSGSTLEEMPTLPGVPSTKTVKPTPPQSDIPTDKPLVSTAKKEKPAIPDQSGLKTDLNSLELSEMAEMKHEEPGNFPSFDGKEHFDMGKVYKEMSLWDAAIAELKTSAMDPRWRAKSCILLADCFRQKGEVVLAISQLKWALSADEDLKEDGDKYNLHFELGLMFEASGNYPEAKEQYQAVHRWNPSHRGVEKKLLELRKKMQSK